LDHWISGAHLHLGRGISSPSTLTFDFVWLFQGAGSEHFPTLKYVYLSKVQPIKLKHKLRHKLGSCGFVNQGQVGAELRLSWDTSWGRILDIWMTLMVRMKQWWALCQKVPSLSPPCHTKVILLVTEFCSLMLASDKPKCIFMKTWVHLKCIVTPKIAYLLALKLNVMVS
jgi:hypothetical protein